MLELSVDTDRAVSYSSHPLASDMWGTPLEMSRCQAAEGKAVKGWLYIAVYL